jgi:hypothetical protein
MRWRLCATLGLLALTGAMATAPAAGGADSHQLNVYTLAGPADRVADAAAGVELHDIEQTPAGTRAEAVLSKSQAREARASGVDVEPVRNRNGRTVSAQASLMAAGGFNVWRSWDEPGGIRDELHSLAADNPDLVELEVIGQSVQGREMIALRVTERGRRAARRPAVLYSSLQHAREWISVEVNRRTLHHFIDRYRAGDRQIRRLLRTTQLWFVLVANPDGYQYSFDGERLWRKNMRDNDGDGQITIADGVDPNRNFDEHWGYDDEGSSNDPTSETYRGTGPASEPETVAMQDLITRIRPKFQSNLHSHGEWLLYPQGWQTGTLDADNPIYTALGGLDSNPSIPGFNPGQSADTLYVTNGETTDFADTHGDTIAYTPELGEGTPGAAFVFPDDEALIQAEFERLLPFHLGLARSAVDPANPVSPTGIEVEPFYLDQDEIDPQNGQQSLFDFKFAVSYGSPQEVRVLAKRSLRRVRLRYRINGGRVQTGRTREWDGGSRYGPGNGTYYHVLAGNVRGAGPGDQVRVWFRARGRRSGSFTYRVESDSGRRVLIVAAEDYTGASPDYPPGTTAPLHLDYYKQALDASNVEYDVYDVDAHGRTAPDNLGVLSHYDAVIWYTGNDVVTREPGWAAGNASRLAQQEIYEVRDFINEGGRVAYTGQRAGQQYTTSLGTQLYDPFENQQCTADPAILERCLPLSGSGDSQGDPIEYWFGAAITSVPAVLADPPFSITGLAAPLDGMTLERNGADSAQNQASESSFIATTDYLGVIDPDTEFPQFESRRVAEYASGISGPFEPHDGSSFMWSQRADEAYKRLTRTIEVPASGTTTLSFWTSYNLEQDFDYMGVEAHTVGQDDWTMLPDANGHTSADLSNDQSCTGGWSNPADEANLLHPFLTHYQTFNPADGTCSNTGTTGEWHAGNGNSSGWQQWSIDLTQYAGQSVEVSITALSDWGLQQFPGVFVDQIEVSNGAEGSTSFEEDADPMDGWTVPGPPQDEAGVEGENANDWIRRGGFGIGEGAAIATPQTLYLGFGFEGITGSGTRNQVMGRIVDHLLD